MKVTIIGGTGHIGTYLVPRLWQSGHEVTVVTRGNREAYQPHPAWNAVQKVIIDRQNFEKNGLFGEAVARLEPDVVIDLISFTPESTRQLVEALRGKVSHFLHCGTIWVKGTVVEAPTTEETPSLPFDDYGINKKAIVDYLLGEARRGNFPATIIHPGHIVGPGHLPVNPLGCKNPIVFTWLAQGRQIPLPNFGMELLHHVHADDVAQVFMKAMERWSASVGEQFFAVSPAAVTLKGFTEAAAGWFNQEADLVFRPWEEWKTSCGLTEEDISMTYDHIARGQCCSIEKARRLLGYEPRYTSFEAVREAVDWLVAQGTI
jgi:nucleoside-diphosphate-sugar epimerase